MTVKALLSEPLGDFNNMQPLKYTEDKRKFDESDERRAQSPSSFLPLSPVQMGRRCCK